MVNELCQISIWNTILLVFIAVIVVIFLTLWLADKIQSKYYMGKEDVWLGMLSQVPIFGGIVLFKKLCEIEHEVKKWEEKVKVKR